MIDIRSDTVTQPDDAMRQAIVEADLGDDVYGEDPTVNELEERVADILEMEAALFCPSGTMANQIAIDCWTEPGQELLLERWSHIYCYEVGGAGRLAGLQTRPVDASPRGSIAGETVAAELRTESLHVAATGLLALENTHNNHGGRALSPAAIREPADVARDHGVPVHLDGARLWNAAVAHDVDLGAYTELVDSVMVSLSKGLGAPVGSMLVGATDFIERARRTRKTLGGGMRQAGVLAAPALQALENRHHLADDHRNAATLATGIAELSGLSVIQPETNIVMVELDADAWTPDAWLHACREQGVLGTHVGEDRARFVTHRDVDAEDIQEAIERIRAASRAD